MSTPRILPWHGESSNAEMHQSLLRPLTKTDVESIIASHDPHASQHAETVRLLEAALPYLEEHQDKADGQTQRLINLCSAIRLYRCKPNASVNGCAGTISLLEDLDAEIQGAMNNAFPEDAPDILDGVGAKIRAHLATLRGEKGTK